MLIRSSAALMRAALSTISILLLLTAAAASHEYAAGQIKIVHPWAPATAPGATVGAGYMKIVNAGPKPIRLVGATTPQATKVEFHSMSMDGGVMRMRPIVDGLIVPARGELQLKRGSLHMMLIGLKRPLVEEDLVPLTLTFEGGVVLNIELYVENMVMPEHQH